MQQENPEALRKIFDFVRFGSILVLLGHYYTVCYDILQQNHFSYPLLDRIIGSLFIFREYSNAKITALVLVGIAILSSQGKKDENAGFRLPVSLLVIGAFLYFCTYYIRYFPLAYILISSIGFLLIVTGGTKLSRIIHIGFSEDVFNDVSETFPQEERLLENEFSVNLPARYKLRGKTRKSWINIINVFRSLLVLGTPGSGKSYFVIRHVITQHIAKGFSFFIYDFKFPDLSVIAYNHLLIASSAYPVPPKMYFINFDDLSRTHRCNVLYPDSLLDITDATESSRTIMLALNREWIKKGGDFFVESPINFTTAIFWYLKKYKQGRYCTLPHAIELAQIPYKSLFQVLSREPEIEVLINPFISAYMNKAFDQLEGQIASAKIGLARLASPSLYYVLSGNDFTLDINNPQSPKVVCVGNNPSKQQIYGAVLSLYIERMLKLVNRKGQMKSSLVFDEFPTVYVNNIDNLIATARSNLVSTTLGIQDFSQLRKDYGKEQADVIMNVAGNIISGQVIGESAKMLSDRIGKIMQDRVSLSINAADTSISKSRQLDAAIPPAKIANLSSGEFVGAVADDPINKIRLKTFHAEIINDHKAIAKETANYKPLPQIREVSQKVVMDNFYAIKKDIQHLIETEMQKIQQHPDMVKSMPKRAKAKSL